MTTKRSVVFSAKLSEIDQVIMTGGSLDDGCIRLGVYQRTGGLLPRYLGYLLVPIEHARQLAGEIIFRLDEGNE